MFPKNWGWGLSAVCAVCIGQFASGAVQASAELAKAKACLGCHVADRRVVGPAYKDVAARYAGQADARELLADKIMKGGRGAWGVVAMPPNPRVTPEEAAQLADWILGLK